MTHKYQFLLLLLGLTFCCPWSLQATNPTPIDSIAALSFLPTLPMQEVHPSLDRLPNGKYPSDYSFSIAEPTEVQIAAWLAGDFDALEYAPNLTLGGPGSKGDLLENTQEAVAQARAIIKKIKEKGEFIQNLVSGELRSIPVGMHKTFQDGTNVTVGIGRIWLKPDYAMLEIFVEVKRETMELPLYLGAPDIKYSRKNGIAGDVALGLLGNFKQPVFEEKADLTFKAAVYDPDADDFRNDQGTFFAFNCEGVQNLNVDLLFEIDTSVVVPVDDVETDVIYEEGEVKKVKGSFRMVLENGLSDILFNLDVEQPFYHVRKPEIIWKVSNVVVDFSETQNSNSMDFAALQTDTGYDPLAQLPAAEHWKGVYIGGISVTWRDTIACPPPSPGSEPAEDSEEEPVCFANDIEIEGRQIVIDRNGFTGYVEANSLIDLEDGDLGGGWGVSVAQLEVHILTNEIQHIHFEGAISVPMLNGQENGEPVLEESIKYSADYDNAGQYYSITANLAEDQVFPMKMLHAEVKIKKTSKFHIGYAEGVGFDVSAELYGNFVIDKKDTGNGNVLNVPDIAFDGLKVTNQAPYLIDGGTWNVSGDSDVQFKGFGMTLDRIEFVKRPNVQEAELRFAAQINIAAGDNVDISAGGAFRLRGDITVNDEGRQQWKFQKVKIDMLTVSFETEGLYVNGEVIFFDSIPPAPGQTIGYGSGFQGKMTIAVGGLNDEESGDGILISAMGLFGSTESSPGGDEFRYFLVDAMVVMGQGIPMGPISLHGFGGGVYYRMSSQEVNEDMVDGDVAGDEVPPDSDAMAMVVAPGGVVGPDDDEGNTTTSVADVDLNNDEENDPTISAYEAGISEMLGQSLSGIKYVPDPSISIGVNAQVIIAGSGSPRSFNANIRFNIQFKDTGSVDKIGLGGLANFSAPISWDGPSCTGTSIALDMEYVFPTNPGDTEGFFASAHAFVNTPLIKGGNSDDNIPEPYRAMMDSKCGLANTFYAGGIEIEMTNENWFINIGRPDNKLALTANFQTDEVDGGVSVAGYLDIGDNIPPFPGLPAKVATLTQLGNIGRNEAALASGVGFALGLSKEVSVGGDFGIFRGSMNAGIGFDMMFQYYPDAFCTNYNQPLGFQGWYAMGQAWAFLEGGMKVGWKNAYYTIFEVSGAAAIQVKAPNPIYGKGAIYGQYSILGGVCKGDCYYEFEVGSECELEDGEDLAAAIYIVNELSPAEEAVNVSVDAKPMLTFNYALGKQFEMPSTTGAEENDKYRYVVDNFSLINTDTGEEVEGMIEALNDYAMQILPAEILLPDTYYTIEAIVTPRKKINNDWTNLESDIRSYTFHTGGALATIPKANIKEAYPADGQFNVYIGEDNLPATLIGNITLAQGQDDLLSSPPEGYVAKVRIGYSHPGRERYVPFTYNAETNSIDYYTSELPQGKAYRLDIVFIEQAVWDEISASGTTNSDGEVESQEAEVNQENGSINNWKGDGITALGFVLPSTMNWNMIGDEASQSFSELLDGEESLLTTYFRVSDYNTLADKMAAATIGELTTEIKAHYTDFSLNNNGLVYTSEIMGLTEPFGIEELKGLHQAPPSIQFTADLTNTPWIDKFTHFTATGTPANEWVNLYGDGGITNYNFLNHLNYTFSNGKHRADYGPDLPVKAVMLYHPNSDAFKVTAANAMEINSGDFSFKSDAKIVYLVPNVIVSNDLPKFRNGVYAALWEDNVGEYFYDCLQENYSGSTGGATFENGAEDEVEDGCPTYDMKTCVYEKQEEFLNSEEKEGLKVFHKVINSSSANNANYENCPYITSRGWGGVTPINGNYPIQINYSPTTAIPTLQTGLSTVDVILIK